MATVMSDKERFIVASPTAAPRGMLAPDAFARHAARGLWAGGLVMLLGSFIDLAVLWGLQFQPNPQWEFVATMNTLEGYIRFAIGIAFIYAGLYVGRSTSLWKYRTVAAFTLLLGIAAALLGLVLLNDYYALSRLTQDQTQAMGALVTSVTKGVMLSGLFTVVFVPLGIMGLRKPRIG
jgi:hypothetical protein